MVHGFSSPCACIIWSVYLHYNLYMTHSETVPLINSDHDVLTYEAAINDDHLVRVQTDIDDN